MLDNKIEDSKEETQDANEKIEHSKEKPNLHERSKHRERYDFEALIKTNPALTPFVRLNAYEDQSINFSDAAAVKMLNKTLLKHHYDLNWDIPPNYLCPPIPGRADYIHHIADLLANSNRGKIPKGNKIKCLDIGVGANCIYPLIGNKTYKWSFIGSEIDKVAVAAANKIIASNPGLKGKIEIRFQPDLRDIFFGIIKENELIDLTVCNPPFHASFTEARGATRRKLRNLGDKKGSKTKKASSNFGGQSNELWCKGGEKRFVKNMVRQSKYFANSCFWFSTLVSQKSNLDVVYEAIEKSGATEMTTIPMGQGNKKSRVVAWTFLTPKQQKVWINTRWS